jgi:hypothetical protein
MRALRIASSGGRAGLAIIKTEAKTHQTQRTALGGTVDPCTEFNSTLFL